METGDKLLYSFLRLIPFGGIGWPRKGPGCCEEGGWLPLVSLASDASCQLDVFGHDCHSFGVDGTKVSVFKEVNEVCLTGFLESSYCGRPESEFRAELLCDFPDKALKGQLSDKKMYSLLIMSDLIQSEVTWSKVIFPFPGWIICIQMTCLSSFLDVSALWDVSYGSRTRGLFPF